MLVLFTHPRQSVEHCTFEFDYFQYYSLQAKKVLYANTTETGNWPKFSLIAMSWKRNSGVKVKYDFPTETDLMFTRRRYNLFMIGSDDIYTIVSIDYVSIDI